MAGKSGADKAVDTVNKVGGALMRQMVAGDKPKVVKTGKYHFYIYCRKPKTEKNNIEYIF